MCMIGLLPTYSMGKKPKIQLFSCSSYRLNNPSHCLAYTLGWWFQPLWKIGKSAGIMKTKQCSCKNKTCSKPPTRCKVSNSNGLNKFHLISVCWSQIAMNPIEDVPGTPSFLGLCRKMNPVVVPHSQSRSLWEFTTCSKDVWCVPYASRLRWYRGRLGWPHPINPTFWYLWYSLIIAHAKW